MIEVRETIDLDARETELLECIEADGRVEFVALISGKRAVIKVPTNLITTHAEILKLRNANPQDISLLKNSVTNMTGGDSLYSISIYAVLEGDSLVYYVGDGVQRLQAIIEAGTTWTYAQVVLSWKDERDAMEAGLSANMARYNMTDGDIFSVIRSGKISDDRIKLITGFPDAKFRRYKLVADYKWMAELVAEGCFGYSKAAGLLQACEKKPERLEALEAELTSLKKTADDGVAEYQNKAMTSNIGKKGRDKTKLSYWFSTFNEQIDAVKAKIELDAVEMVGGKWQVAGRDVAKSVVATIGTDAEWKQLVAVFDFFGRKIHDVSLASYDEVLANWAKIEKLVKAARAQVALQQGTQKPQSDMAAISPPADQHPSSAVDNS